MSIIIFITPLLLRLFVLENALELGFLCLIHLCIQAPQVRLFFLTIK